LAGLFIVSSVRTGTARSPQTAAAHISSNRGDMMQYQISGKQLDIGEALQTHVQTELNEMIEKYPGRPTDAQVVFSKDAHEFVCESVVHLSTGLTVQARGRAGEIYAAFDSATEKMGKQLRRYKRRLKDHYKERPVPVELSGASSYILAAQTDDEMDEPDSLAPMIIAEMEVTIPQLSVGEAVMQMELAGAPVLVFRNDKQDAGINIVYRRDDGNIGWIDPKTAK